MPEDLCLSEKNLLQFKIIKFHLKVMFISSALNFFKSKCQTNNSLCIAMYLHPT